MAEKCLFCSIVGGDIPCFSVYRDDTVCAFLDIHPLTHGHCLLIPTEHYGSLDQCPQSVLAVLVGKLGPIARAVVDAVNADGYNILNNTGPAAGQVIDHLHFHIIPRRSNDGAVSCRKSQGYPPGRADELAGQIKSRL